MWRCSDTNRFRACLRSTHRQMYVSCRKLRRRDRMPCRRRCIASWHARPDAMEELTALLASLASNRERSIAMGQRGYEYVRTSNTREMITRQYEEIVQRLAAS